MITLQGVHFKREQRTILSDVNFQVNPGEHWVLLGKNGSGKTTLLEIMNAYQFPSEGKVTIMDQTYGECDVREVRKSIGYISQSLLDKLNLRDPVWECVAGGEFGYLRFYEEIPAEVKEKTLAQLEAYRIGFLAEQPLGTLSQGERKKVLLARAMLTKPSILIMDEPCSGLDLYERERLLELVNGLNGEQVTVIYVTHHIEEIVPLFTHVALVKDGQIIAAGPKEEALTEQNISKAYDVPVRLEWDRGRPWIKVV